jgi:hypothetical protein
MAQNPQKWIQALWQQYYRFPLPSYTLGCLWLQVYDHARVGETFPPAIDAHATHDYVSKPGYVLHNPAFEHSLCLASHQPGRLIV